MVKFLSSFEEKFIKKYIHKKTRKSVLNLIYDFEGNIIGFIDAFHQTYDFEIEKENFNKIIEEYK
jgi:hypothetical protein